MIEARRRQDEGLSDAAIVAEIASGNVQSLGLLFDRYEPDVRRLLRRLEISRSDADDLIQATFLQVVPASQTFDHRYAVRSWLLGIAAMMARRHRRSTGQISRGLMSFAKTFISKGSLTPGEAYESQESGHRLRMSLSRLSPKRREAFVLVVLEEVPGDEAAAALGIPVNTLWTRLHHARCDLRRWLEPEGQ